MHRKALLDLLSRYAPLESESSDTRERFIRFVADNPDCFRREHQAGHVTASAWVVSPDRRRALLIRHRGLDRWLQPGGHADGDPDLERVARKETAEETGVAELTLVDRELLDIDIHRIPAAAGVPEHLHFDARFLFLAVKQVDPARNHEALDAGWFTIEEILRLTREESVLRMAEKSRRRFADEPDTSAIRIY